MQRPECSKRLWYNISSVLQRTGCPYTCFSATYRVYYNALRCNVICLLQRSSVQRPLEKLPKCPTMFFSDCSVVTSPQYAPSIGTIRSAYLFRNTCIYIYTHVYVVCVCVWGGGLEKSCKLLVVTSSYVVNKCIQPFHRWI